MGKKINVSVAGSLETDTGQKTSTLMEQLEGLPEVELYSFLSSSTQEAQIVLERARLTGKFKHSIKDKRFYTDNLDFFLLNNSLGFFISLLYKSKLEKSGY